MICTYYSWNSISINNSNVISIFFKVERDRLEKLTIGNKNAIFLFLGSLGIANLWSAVFADVGVALLAIFNATRVLRS